ncbi:MULTISPECIES: CDP-diacylglycerol--glycerol-3-phosphate 3-phosphatidyltransferase [Cryobacterium]|uniref:CDP-diacylglycerol--glycerol-3-phosphate 3-phosphatidyltransferase n=1 Tax=Cryobacterium levicorallinum TaxID=995038 RepID=A0A1I3B4R6_9MICO|nr:MULTISPECIES: CDP-diacylglycerol--glycerol-3-phosphate 3-phosphatidyltransferase [Cryobacterium]TFB83495.1 CDP-diacylglycerol--glycerol-3-phosphate 3-phosphatidyltransferase [Cryobacterium levicorallinum]TFD23728.1 CDP-diacylglycerol--glycerol-3-phosphate 3-phosphatidyltransferase [Cryobacterium sp. TMS1-13-1]TFD64800.1 CDP-diacylglycerol--glycerol-3-phosphate 3-phosphatidyltransferase [Cryobacterium sp. Hh38]SFH56711.1 CDP-diacylglycerol--glycerol-3-phosphate 3-phosphatidyltransferase [Cryo
MASPQASVARPSNWNLPNLITVVRILLAPVFIWMLLADNGAHDALRWAAAVLFIIAIATDGIDGMIARRHNLVTDLGKILDPIADKILTGGALVCLSILDELPWWVTIVILVREIGITVFRFVMLRDRVIPASRGGKLKTVSQSVSISLALLPFWLVFGEWVHWLNTATMTITLILTVVSGLDYLLSAWRLRKHDDA